MKVKIIASMVVLFVGLAFGLSMASIKEDFDSGIPVADILKNAIKSGQTIEKAVAEASTISPKQVCDIISNAIEMFPDNAVPIVQAAVGVGADEDAVVRCAVLAGADPVVITVGAAAGRPVPTRAFVSLPQGGDGGGGFSSPSRVGN